MFCSSSASSWRADGVGLLLQLALQREIDVGFGLSIS